MSKKKQDRNKWRDWILDRMEDAFKANLTERDYRIINEIEKRYNPLFFGKIGNDGVDRFLINIAYQIGKMEGRKGK